MAEPLEPPTLLLPAGDASTSDAPCPAPKGVGISGIAVLVMVSHTKNTLFLCPVSKLTALNTILGHTGKQIFLLCDAELCT